MLPPEQTRDLELAVWNYLHDKGYSETSERLLAESETLAAGEPPAPNEERLLERKWLTIVRLQTRIVELERKLAHNEELLARSVRTLNSGPQDGSGSGGGAAGDALTSPALRLSKAYKGHKDAISSVALHESEPVFASGSGDSTVRVYDYELQTQVALLKGHTHGVNCVAWAKEELLSGSSDMSIKIWRSANKGNVFDFAEFFCSRTLVGHEHSVSALLNVPDTDFTVSVSRDKTVRLWDRVSGFCRKTVADAHEDWVRCLDANARHLVTSGNDKKVFVFELEAFTNTEKKNGYGGETASFLSSFDAHDNYVESIRVFRQGNLNGEENVAVTASRDKTVCVWNYLTGALLAQFTGHENWVKDVVVFEEFFFAVSAGEDKTLRVWDLRKKKQVFVETSAHDHFLTCLALHKDFRVLLSGSVDRQAKIWKLVNASSQDVLNALVGG